MSAESFGQLLRQYRVAAGFSQEHLAEVARLSAFSISALERGLRQAPYRNTVQRIAKALGLGTSQAIKLEAAADIARRRRPGARSGTPHQSGNLPAGIVPCIGRGTDVENLARLIAANRLVTITGTGGVGKTRLAIEVASEVRRAFGPPVFVDLATAESGTSVCNAIASAIANPSRIAHHDPQTLARSLGATRLFIVLDTCEHILPDVARAIVAILRFCPSVALLATSRQRVGVSGERVYKVAPLALPEGPVADLREARAYASVDFFIQRAAFAEHGVSFTNGSAEIVASICRILDGIPLLIELAATRVGVLGLQALAARLHQGLEPGNVNRDAPPRHQTALASMAWSYRLLTNDEQKIFTHLSVFPGAFTLEEAETACVADGLAKIEISDELSSLVEKNLIEAGASGKTAHYWMLNTVRRFASRRHADPAAKTP